MFLEDSFSLKKKALKTMVVKGMARNSKLVIIGLVFFSAKKLNNEGAQVVITGRDEDKVNEAAKELGVIGIVADVSDLHATDTLV